MNTHKFESHGIEVSIVNFSPVQAARILDTINDGNRKVATSRVEQYKRDMINGSWRFNGDMIRIDENGVLIDGQHRLSAVVRSGMSFEFLVVKGIRSESKHTIDTGKARTGGDALSIQAGVEFADSHVINGALSAYVKYKRSGYSDSGSGHRLTNTEVLATYESHKELVDSSLSMMKDSVTMRGMLLPKVDMLFLFMIFSELDPDDAKNYLLKILTGVGLDFGSTEVNIRDIMIECKTGARTTNRKIIINSIIKCWNSIRRGGGIKLKQNCVWRPTSENAPVAK